MKNEEWLPYLTDLIGEAAMDVILNYQSVTTDSIIFALKERMQEESNGEKILAYKAAIDMLKTYVNTAGTTGPAKENDVSNIGSNQYQIFSQRKHLH